MTGPLPFFIFGVARSGTNLVARMLDAHPHAAVALDPLLPLFRSWRNQVAEQSAHTLTGAWNPQSSLQDYYFSRDGAALLRMILDADPAQALPPGGLEHLQPAVVDRAALESPNLAAAFAKWTGSTWGELLASTVRIISDGKAVHAAGVKEVWTVEFIPAIRRALPDARFIILHRDPRAVAASQMAMARKDPTQAAHSISYMRHWRKHVTLARLFSSDSSLGDQVLEVRYEDILLSPKQHAENLAGFLGLDFDPAMLAPGKEQGWESNSSFTSAKGGVDAQAGERWRGKLPAHAVATVEFHCGIEMRNLGYEPTRAEPGRLDAEVLRGIAESNAAPGKWRSDSGDEAADLAWECLRWQLAGPAAVDVPSDLMRRCFLQPELPN
ncbi:MAG: sulfotransferase [Verrucomicrobiaceae bacterium]|nr:sulfotransferase [Verrucomicrobiaceae bacterium]